MGTFAQLMINSKLPSAFHFSGAGTKSKIYDTLTNMAQANPAVYSEGVHHMKQVGDFFATNEGISVGLDDIEPEYKLRDAIISRAKKDIGKLTTEEAKKRRLLKAQEEGIALAKAHKGSLGKMTLSGGRGSFGQLIKTVVSPITVKGPDDTPTDFLMTKSYSEGVTPGEFWMGAGEARREAAKGNLATALPGDSAKQLSNTLNKVTISERDCGTRNGIMMDVTDKNIMGRYLAGSNILVTEDVVQKLKRDRTAEVKSRSPLTCEAQPGVCQFCYGLNAYNKVMDVGAPIGLRAAQALSEPLTQMVLSSKHGGNMAKIDDALPSGMEGFRQLVDIPKQFKAEATLAEKEGRVSNIDKLPHGGHNVFIGKDSHFVHPNRKLLVRRGDYVGKGEALSSGVENPRKVTELKGLGSGRKYLLDSLHGVYSDSGIDMDKRNLEVLVREDINHVEVTKSDPAGEFVRGEIVPYNRVKAMVERNAKSAPFSKEIIGKTLGENRLQYTSGTEITPEIYADLRRDKAANIRVSNDSPAYKPLMFALERVPSLSQDVIGRMAHRRIKDTLIDGASQSFETATKDSPIANYIYNNYY